MAARHGTSPQSNALAKPARYSRVKNEEKRVLVPSWFRSCTAPGRLPHWRSGAGWTPPSYRRRAARSRVPGRRALDVVLRPELVRRAQLGLRPCLSPYDASVIRNRPPASPAGPLQGRAWALPLLVIAVLSGVLSMHGLGSAPPPGAHPHRAMPHSAAMAMAADGGGHAAHAAHGHGRSHNSRLLPGSQHADECECGGASGHVAHADVTCSASGTSGAPSMDGPANGTATGPQPATGLEGCWSRTGGERAPPSLHRLQLLRI
jgi:uncharacterized protein DUF6153